MLRSRRAARQPYDGPMDADSIARFDAEARAAGHLEILDRDWAAGVVVERHSHPFAVRALVLRGELWLGCRGQELHLLPGDRFTLDRDEPHTERYGPEGASYHVARRA